MSQTRHETLESIEIETSSPIKKSVIWLHGLGADGHDFAPIVPELHLPANLGIRFIFPHAPVMPITLNNGYKMRAWFDIEKLSLSEKIDIDGIKKSISQVNHFIEQEIARGLLSTDIFIAGFSQGAAIALMTGLSFKQKLAGIIALSGYLPLPSEILSKAHEANRNTPIFIAHGTQDATLPFFLGENISKLLKEAGYPVNWHAYAMGHSVCLEEIKDLSEWIQKQSQGK